LSIITPTNAEKLIDEFEVPHDIPNMTQQLMVDAIDLTLAKLKQIETKLERLRSSLSGGEKR
jgi:ABC-type molybdate transport system ATPase subunit